MDVTNRITAPGKFTVEYESWGEWYTACERFSPRIFETVEEASVYQSQMNVVEFPKTRIIQHFPSWTE